METQETNGFGLPLKILVVGIFGVMVFSFFNMSGVNGNVIDMQAECEAAWGRYEDAGYTALSQSEYMSRCRGPVEVKNINDYNAGSAY